MGCLSACLARGEHLVASAYAPTGGYTITIYLAYQIGDEIWVSSYMTRPTEGAVTQGVEYPVDSVEVDYPSIVAKDMGNLQLPNNQAILYWEDHQVRSYNYSLGDGWVDTDAAGWLYIRSYPWVLHPRLGWLYVTESVISGDQLPEEANIEGSGIKKMTYNFWSFQHGWLWKSPYTERYYSYEGGIFLSVGELSDEQGVVAGSVSG